MAILVSDSNIIIDMTIGELTRRMFQLEDVIATPDVLYREELAEHHAELPALGLRIEPLSDQGVTEVTRLVQVYRGPSTNDLFALVLAKERQWTLLTGDGPLREAAVAEDVEVHGTIWMIDRMITANVISAARARTALDLMRDGQRRLPWDLADEMLGRYM